MKKTEKLHRRIFYFTYNNQVSPKLANFQILPNGGGGPFTPIWGVSNAPRP